MADEFDRVKDDIRRRTDIVDLVGQLVSLRRNGRNWTGLCPFHDDKNPSFVVSTEYGHYRCWSCGAKGDVFTWVMETQKLTFGEALKALAKEAGVELPKSRAKPEASDSWDAAMSSALSFFRDQLKKTPLAANYVAGRGIPEAAAAKWELGYAPDVGEALAMHLQKAGFTLAECRKLFLVDQDAGGGYFDKFRGRLMFPIRDERSRLVAFGGRIIGDGQPKYINSGDTPLFSKSRVLYGLDRAKEAVSKAKVATVVEGYLDVIACHEAGVETAVATLGTSLTDQHAKLLKRWCDKVVLLYDGDEAGQKAADRGAEILEAEGLTVHIALMPPGDDPDTLLRREGPQAVQKAAAHGVTPLEFRLAATAKKFDPTGTEYWTEIVEVFAKERSEMEAQRHLHRIAAEYPGIKDKVAARQALGRTISKRKRELSAKTVPKRRPPSPGLPPRRWSSHQPGRAPKRPSLLHSWNRPWPAPPGQSSRTGRSLPPTSPTRSPRPLRQNWARQGRPAPRPNGSPRCRTGPPRTGS